MRSKTLRALGGGLTLTLAALAPTAWADSASVSLSNVKVQVIDAVPGDDVWPWLVFFSGDSSWLSFTTLAGAHAESPAADPQSQGWLGSVQAAAASGSRSQAQAATSAGDFYGATGPGASAWATATDGAQAWAYANVFNGLFLAGAQTKFIVTATVDGINASGADAQANASIEICFTDGTCNQEGYSEALAFSGLDFPAPPVLRAEWSNPYDTASWGTMNISMAASATAAASPVPEADIGWQLMAGLLCVAAARRRR